MSEKRFARLWFNLLAIGVALAGLAATLALSRFLVARERAQLQRRTEAEAKHVAGQIRSGLLQRFDPLQRLGLWWLSQGRPLAAEDWQTDAQLFLSATAGLKQVLWFNAKGRQVWSVRPGLPPRLGRLDRPPDPALKPLAATARRLNSVVVSGLFSGDTGAEALYACAPVSRRGRLVGYAVGLYNASELLNSVLERQLPGDYSVAITAGGRNIQAFNQRGQRQWAEGAQMAEIILPNTTWSARIVPSAADIASLQNLIMNFGLLLTALLYICTAIAGTSRLRASALERANGALQIEIHERRRAEEKVAELNRDLRRRLVDFQTLIEVIPVGIAVSDDPECANIWINPTLAKMMGVPQGQNISKTGAERDSLVYKLCRDGNEVPGEELPMQLAARTGAEVLGAELDIVREDGRIINTLSFSSPLFDENGRVRGVLNACVDITERKQTEQALRDNEERYRLLAEALPQLVWTSRADGYFDYLSRQWIEYTGAREGEHLGSGWIEVLHPEDRQRVLASWQAAVEERGLYDLEYRLRGSDGAYRWFKTRGVPLRDGSGRILKWFGTCTDIEDQKRAAEEVRGLYLLAERRAAELAAVIESIPDAVYIGNADGLSRCNSVALKLLGACTFDHLQKGFCTLGEMFNLRSPSGRCLRAEELPFTRALNGETVIEEVIATRIDTGTDIFLRVTAAPVQQDGRVVGAVLMNADVTERKRLEQKLFEKQRLESIGLLAGGVAHDFNNLLGAIMGNASLVQSRLWEGDINHTQLQAVLDAAKRAADLTRQLLAYAGKGKFVIQPVDVSALARNITNLLRTSISRVINLELDLEEGLPCIEADPGQIQQVVMNLVINAAEAIGEGQAGTVRVAARTEELNERNISDELAAEMPAGRYVLLEVNDTGCGMDDQTRRRIFDPFFTTKSTGRGLGLSAVSGIVRSHNGFLIVNSTPGRGTSFRIWLPAAQNAPRSASVDEPQGSCRGAGTILVVDDEEMMRNMTKAMLEHQGYTVLLAENGQIAVDAFTRHFDLISLVLLDLTMPVMSGQETLLRLKAICGKVPVIISSGYSADDVGEDLKTQGAAAFIQKPYTASQLTRLIQEILKVAMWAPVAISTRTVFGTAPTIGL